MNLMIILYIWLVPVMVCQIIERKLNLIMFFTRFGLDKEQIQLLRIGYWIPIINLLITYIYVEILVTYLWRKRK